MSSDLVNLLIEEYEKYKTNNCEQSEKNIKEFYKLIQQDLENYRIFIIYDYRYCEDVIKLYCIDLDGLGYITIYSINLTEYIPHSNNLYIYKSYFNTFIMKKELYRKILNDSNK
jgi:hypothetical protein